MRKPVLIALVLIALVTLWASLRNTETTAPAPVATPVQTAPPPRPALPVEARAAPVAQRRHDTVPAARVDDLATLATELAAARTQPEAATKASALRATLTQTRLALLDAWATTVQDSVPMTAKEQRAFAAIVAEQAKAISGGSKVIARPSDQIRALLGPGRYDVYESRRKAVFPDGSRYELVMP